MSALSGQCQHPLTVQPRRLPTTPPPPPGRPPRACGRRCGRRCRSRRASHGRPGWVLPHLYRSDPLTRPAVCSLPSLTTFTDPPPPHAITSAPLRVFKFGGRRAGLMSVGPRARPATRDARLSGCRTASPPQVAGLSGAQAVPQPPDTDGDGLGRFRWRNSDRDHGAGPDPGPTCGHRHVILCIRSRTSRRRTFS